MITDVLIIGSGLAGLRSAEVCANNGLDVTVICNGAGASPFVHGISVPLQQGDSPTLFYNDTLKSGYYHNDKKLVKVLCEQSLSLLNEFSFDKIGEDYDLLKALGSSLPRVAFVNKNTGATIIKNIETKAKYKKLNYVRAYELIKHGDSVRGAKCFDVKKNKHFQIHSKAVILACGGFGGIFPFSTNSKDIGGDGVAMSYNVGATLKDLEFIQFEPTVAVSPTPVVGKSIITTMLYEGAVIKNKHGKRFMNERQDKDALSLGIYREISKGLGTENAGVYYDMTGVDKTLLTDKYINYYNRYKQVGVDISTTPVEIAPAPHTTMGGVAIDQNCQTTINGLFACGEVTGGLHGANRLGGNAGLEVLIFGKLAGKNCAKFVKENDFEVIDDTATFDDVFIDTTDLESAVHTLAYESLNVVKNRSKMKTALKTCNKLLSKIESNAITGSYNLIRVKNDLTTIKLVLETCLLRTYSVGSCKIDGLDDYDAEKFDAYSICVHKLNDKTVFEKELL